jgi:hypothetical protein
VRTKCAKTFTHFFEEEKKMNFTKIVKTNTALLIMGVLLSFVTADTAMAFPMRFDVSHTITLAANLGLNQSVETIWDHDLMAIVSQEGVTDGPKRDKESIPSIVPNHDTHSVSAQVGSTVATASASYSTALVADGAMGSHRAWGNTNRSIPPVPGVAGFSASSTLHWRTVARDAQGKIIFQGQWQFDGIEAVAGDPMSFIITDLDNETVWQDTLWSVDMRSTGDNSSQSMDLGNFNASGTGTLSIIAGSSLLAMGTASIDLAWENDVITQSASTGFWAGILPAVGTPTGANLFHIGDTEGNMEFDYDFAPENNNGFQVDLSMSGWGQANATLTPEPATLMLLGLGGLILRKR